MLQAKDEGKRVVAALRSLQVQNELLHVEIDGLKAALNTKQRYRKKSMLLDLHDSEGKRGTGTIWSLRTVRRAAQHNEEIQRQEEELQLQKARRKEEQSAATARKKLEPEAAKAQRKAELARKKEESEGCTARRRACAQKATTRHYNLTKILRYTRQGQADSFTERSYKHCKEASCRECYKWY